jgi:hypothetical protein
MTLRLVAMAMLSVAVLCSCPHGYYWCDKSLGSSSGHASPECGGGSNAGEFVRCKGGASVSIQQGPLCTVNWNVLPRCGANGELMCGDVVAPDSMLECTKANPGMDAAVCADLWERCKAISATAASVGCSAPRSDEGVIGTVSASP